MRLRSLFLAIAPALAPIASCGFGDVSLEGKACDPSGRCSAGWTCDAATNVCVSVQANGSSGGVGSSGATPGTPGELPPGTPGAPPGTPGMPGPPGTPPIPPPTGPLWIAEESNVGATLTGVAVADDGRAVAVGNGTLLRRGADGSWSPGDAQGLNLVAVAVTGSHYWAVAQDGSALRSTDDGATWTKLTLTSVELTSVSAAAGFVAVAGASSYFARGSSSSTPTVQAIAGASGRFSGVSIVDADVTWLVSDGGRFVRRTGGSTLAGTANMSVTGGALTAVTAGGSGVYAIGTGGNVERLDVNSQPRSLTPATLRGVYTLDGTEVFVVGDSGMLFVGSGAAWTQQRPSAIVSLRAVAGNVNGLVIAVGAAGTIMRRP